MEDLSFAIWGCFVCLVIIAFSTCADAAPGPTSGSVFVAQQQRAKPDRLRACELQIYALQDRVGKLENTVDKHKKADDQVLIDLIKRTNSLYQMLTTHQHGGAK